MAEALALFVSVCTVASCRAPTNVGPEQTVQVVLEHLYKGQWEPAWGLITEANQQTLLDHHRQRSEAAGTPPTDLARDAFLDFGLRVHALPETTILASHPDRSPAHVRVTLPEGPGTTLNVHQTPNGQWKVDLLSALKPYE